MTNEELERLAKAATGGDWRAHITRSRSPEIYTNVPPPNTPNPKIAGVILRKADAAFIAAANPATILALLSERAELLAVVERMRVALQPFAEVAEEFSVCGDGQPISIKAASGKSDLNVGHLRRAAEAAK